MACANWYESQRSPSSALRATTHCSSAPSSARSATSSGSSTGRFLSSASRSSRPTDRRATCALVVGRLAEQAEPVEHLVAGRARRARRDLRLSARRLTNSSLKRKTISSSSTRWRCAVPLVLDAEQPRHEARHVGASSTNSADSACGAKLASLGGALGVVARGERRRRAARSSSCQRSNSARSLPGSYRSAYEKPVDTQFELLFLHACGRQHGGEFATKPRRKA